MSSPHRAVSDPQTDDDNPDTPSSLANVEAQAQSTLLSYLQDLDDADKPAPPAAPKFHTGKLPNSKAADGKPRLLLMGQRR
jgi:Ras-related GTP-binding protein C/D